MKSELQNQQTMSKGLSDAGLDYDPNHPSIIEELLQVTHPNYNTCSKSMSGRTFRM